MTGAGSGEPSRATQASGPRSDTAEPSATEPAPDEQDDTQLQQIKPRTRFKSIGTMVTGIVLTGVGGSSAIAGLYWMSFSDAACDMSYDPDATCPAEALRTTGTVLLVAGAAMVAVGIPLIVIGSKRVPADSAGWVAPPVFTASVGLGPGALGLSGTW